MSDPFQVLCKTCSPRAWALAARITGCASDADDVLQDAFIVALRRRSVIPPEPWPWFCVVIINCARNYMRKRSRVKPLENLEIFNVDERTLPPYAAANANDLHTRIKTNLDLLPTAEREAIAMCVIGGLSHTQASEVTGINANTLKTRVRRGIEKLRKELVGTRDVGAYLSALPALTPPGGDLDSAVAKWMATARSEITPAAPKKILEWFSIAGGIAAVFVLSLASVYIYAEANSTGRKFDSESSLAHQSDVTPKDSLPRPAISGPSDATVRDAAPKGAQANSDTTPNAKDATPGYEQKTDTADPAMILTEHIEHYVGGELKAVGQKYVDPISGMEYLHGKLTVYHWENYVSDIQFYDRGIPVGEWRSLYSNKSVFRTGSYSQGKRIGTWMWYYKGENGAEYGPKMAIEEYKDGALSGKRTFYHYNQNKSRESEYLEGKLNGLRTEYREDGTKERETNYKDDRKHGLECGYDEQERLILKSNFADGKKHGTEYEYNEKGQLIRESNFFMDLKEGEEHLIDPESGRIETRHYRKGK